MKYVGYYRKAAVHLAVDVSRLSVMSAGWTECRVSGGKIGPERSDQGHERWLGRMSGFWKENRSLKVRSGSENEPALAGGRRFEAC